MLVMNENCEAQQQPYVATTFYYCAVLCCVVLSTLASNEPNFLMATVLFLFFFQSWETFLSNGCPSLFGILTLASERHLINFASGLHSTHHVTRLLFFYSPEPEPKHSRRLPPPW